MTWLSDIKERIVIAIRDEPLDHFQIAAAIGEPPFRVRAELQDLRRDRLARNTVARGHVVWSLTVRGEHLASSAAQTTLPEVTR